MSWNRLLTPQRLGTVDRTGAQPCAPADDPLRTNYQRDFDRIIFCSAFRRLQDKTQVFPLSKIDYVRTRLTHSLEASSIGRSLGTQVGQTLIERHPHDLKDTQAADIGSICAAACLAHDIGNPPFGHSGEEAIRHWARTSSYARGYLTQLNDYEQADLLAFEGNAQGFRIVTRLQNPDNTGGLQLTCATLATFSKYPRTAHLTGPTLSGVSVKKHGVHVADFDLFAQVAQATHLIPHTDHTHAWHRHPFAFLVEAADDIAYRVIDIEDGYRLGHLTYATAAEALSALLPAQDPAKNRLQQIREPKDRIEFLRAKAISHLTQQAAACFLDQAKLILQGQLDQPLCDQLDCRVQLDELLKLARTHIYCAPEVVEIQAAGFRVIGDLLDYFLPVIDDVARQGDQASAHSRMLIQLIPTQFILSQDDPAATPYTRLLHLTDFISGMTDSYAVALYKKVTGIALPAG